MIRHAKKILIGGLFATLLFLGSTFIWSSAPVHAQPLQIFSASCQPGVDGLVGDIFPPWYKYLEGETSTTTTGASQCSPKFPTNSSGDTDVVKGITLILLAIAELLTRVSALVAVGFVIYGSIQYITSQGESQNLSNAKTTIANALVGFIIVVLATAIVQFLGRALS